MNFFKFWPKSWHEGAPKKTKIAIFGTLRLPFTSFTKYTKIWSKSKLTIYDYAHHQTYHDPLRVYKKVRKINKKNELLMHTKVHVTLTISKSREFFDQKIHPFYQWFWTLIEGFWKKESRPLGSPENPTGGHGTIGIRVFKVEAEKHKIKII